MLNEIEIKIINDLEEMSAESSEYENMKENYINLSKEEKQVYYKEIAAVYNCTEKEAKRAANYFAYDCKEIIGDVIYNNQAFRGFFVVYIDIMIYGGDMS